MARDSQNKVSLIKQNDPFSAQRPHFDFQVLRQEGLKHIGDLSGKIWTDHNAHDPGVTILEELCYALIDLGYRTTLPMQDLLAQPRDDSPINTEDDKPRHENFFTPLEILSCNPTTILDFRKLLLDIDGVRNAWLEPDASDTGPISVVLNGLYNILIQKEIDADEEKVIQSVVKMLSAHRNLCEDFNFCEDFSLITILRPLEVGVCADVDIEETADAATVYEAIIRSVTSYIMPELRYYTLTELLNKGRAIGYELRLMSVSATTELVDEGHRLVIVAFVGANLHIRIFDISGEKTVDKSESELIAGDTLTALKQRLTPLPDEGSLSRQEKQEIIASATLIAGNTLAIEDIFAGRPLLGSHSAGFVDTEDLEALPFRDELHGSDLYAAILDVEGVVAVRNLAFQTPSGESDNTKTIPCVCVDPGWVAEFSLDRTCINLQASQGMLFLDKETIHRRLLEGGKPKLGIEYLDLAIPEGRYRPDLADYYSIQHDFPLVYGVGKGGLPREATPLRKVQAMQLKGYLLFYDQLLANYLAQIANLRYLFSLQVESKRPESERHTYFSQDLESVPDRERLVPSHPGKALSDGSILAVPVVNDSRFATRLEELRAYPLTELLITDSCEPVSGEIPHFSEPSKSLLEVRIRQSIRDFRQGDYSLELARDRNGYLFILRFQQTCELLLVSYHRYKNQDEAREAANFGAFLASRSEYYASRLQHDDLDDSQIQYQYNLVYDPAAYSAYLQFLVENEALYLQRREAFLDHLLARFATQFTDYALLRFKAQGEEKSESRQTIEDKSRFLSRVDDLSRDRGRAFDYTQPSWGTENVSGFEKRVSLLAGMQDFRRRHLCKFEIVERFRMEIKDPQGNLWFSSIETYPTKEKLGAARKDVVEQLRDPGNYGKLQRRTRNFDPVSAGRIFSCVATDENIEVSRYVYASTLKDSSGDVLRESSKKDYATRPLAWRGLSKFIKEIEQDIGMELVETGPKSRLYIDIRQMQCRIDPIITYKWHRTDFLGEHIASASVQHPSPVSAINDLAKSADIEDLIVSKTDVALWSLNPGEEHPPLVSIHAFDNEMEARRAWLRSKSDGQIKERYRQDPEPGGQGVRITLTAEGGVELATAIISRKEILDADVYVQQCQAEFGQDEPKLDFPTLPSAFGWQLAQQGENALTENGEIMESVLLFRDVPGALFGLLDALVAVKDATNYFEAGTEDNPDYRILLRSSWGGFIATTRSYADATERKKNLKLIQDRLMQLHPPLEVREEPRLYRWKLCRTTGEHVVLKSSKKRAFNDEAAAKKDFEQEIRNVYDAQPASLVGQQVYVIGVEPREDKYRFIYCLNGPSGEALPLLQSAEEYGANEVRRKYTDFVNGLPKMQRENGSVQAAGTDVPAAVLIGDTEGNRLSVDRILEFMRTQYGDTLEKIAQPKWIYRLLDRDNPIAKSKKSYQTKDEAQAEKDMFCRYRHCREYEACPKKDIVRIICTESDPHKYHYALFLGTKDECPTLISYMGYPSEDAARTAGDENWLMLIERAADKGNYGDDKIITEKETYAESTGSGCDRAGVHLAVKPKTVETHRAIILAKCYPIRISYKKDDAGNPTTQVIGFHFQGYDEDKDTSRWRSAIDYSNADHALEAYQLFLTLLGNSESCRIECDEGCYRMHLVEILAESREFDTKAEAWGDMSEVEGDAGGRNFCPAQGVRLFAQTATSETAFIPVRDGDCYRFEVVNKGYVLARHTCDYHSRAERDKAKDDLHSWVENGSADLSRLPDLQVDKQADGYRFRLYYPENADRLDGKLTICGCPEVDDSKEQTALSFCGQNYVYESTESYPCRDAAEKAFIHFLDLLAEFDNYKDMDETGLGTFSFSIIDSDQVLALHPHSHPDRTSAMRAEERVRACVSDEGMHLIEHILLRPQTDEHCKDLLPILDSSDHLCTLEWQEDFDPDDACAEENISKLTYVPGSDPYSFWATLVLPSWTDRFRNSERRHFFRQMLYREVPAMVGLNIVWVGPHQMYEFEKVLKPWLSSKRLPSALCQGESDPFCCMVKFIGELCNEPLCPDPDIAAATCDCFPGENTVQDDECIEESESLFWLACESGEIPEIIECEVTDGTEVTEDMVVTVDAAAIRKAITERTEAYKKDINDVEYKPATSTKSYDQIRYFLKNPATLDAFKLLNVQMVEDISRKGTKKGEVLVNVYQKAVWYLLDHLMQEHPKEIPPEVKKALPQLLQAMEAKGVVLDDLAKGWKGEVFGELFGSATAKIVNEYLELIKKG